MYHDSIIELAGVFALVTGILYILVGITHFLLPRAQLRGAGGVDADFYESLARSSLVFSLHYWIVAILSLFTIGVIAGLWEFLSDYRSGFLGWASIVGVGGALLATVDFIYVGIEAPKIARRFTECDTSAKQTILALGLPHIDPCFLAFGLLGLYSLVVNITFINTGLIPNIPAYIGIMGGIMFGLAFIGSVIRKSILIDIAAGLGGFIIGPVWFIWIGIIIMKL
jgi:hypothetical protein